MIIIQFSAIICHTIAVSLFYYRFVFLEMSELDYLLSDSFI